MPVRSFDCSFTDPRRDRTITYWVYYPAGWRGPLPIVLLSHGGVGSTTGQAQLGHFGTERASAGFPALHLKHLPSATMSQRYADRSADVTANIDRIEARSLPLPADGADAMSPSASVLSVTIEQHIATGMLVMPDAVPRAATSPRRQSRPRPAR